MAVAGKARLVTITNIGSISQILYHAQVWVGGFLLAVALVLLLTVRPCRSKWFLVTWLTLGLISAAAWYGFSLFQRSNPTPAPTVYPIALVHLHALHLLTDLSLLAFVFVWKREREDEPPAPPPAEVPGPPALRS